MVRTPLTKQTALLPSILSPRHERASAHLSDSQRSIKKSVNVFGILSLSPLLSKNYPFSSTLDPKTVFLFLNNLPHFRHLLHSRPPSHSHEDTSTSIDSKSQGQTNLAVKGAFIKFKSVLADGPTCGREAFCGH